jgi:Zn-dependent peptidase ImmA (M78 family)
MMAELKKRQSRRPNAHSVGAGTRAAEAHAAQVLESLGVFAPPIPVERVALRLGLRVERAPLGDGVSGLLVIQDGRGMIGVSATQSAARQRFTIAHEIGHFVLHKDVMPVFIDKQFLRPYLAAFRDAASATGEDVVEREANAFAAALLMPANLVHAAVAKLGVDVADDDAIEELARWFQVSRQAMTFRVANLSLATERR